MKATEIMISCNKANVAIVAAEKLAEREDQDWTNEATLYTFDDESVLVVSGPQLNAFASMTEAKAALKSAAILENKAFDEGFLKTAKLIGAC